MFFPRLSLALLCAATVCAQEVKTSQNDDRLREGLTLPEATAFLEKWRKPKADAPPANALKPDLREVAYGPHERNILDFYPPNPTRPRRRLSLSTAGVL